jgi:hypothetical protein
MPLTLLKLPPLLPLPSNHWLHKKADPRVGFFVSPISCSISFGSDN